MTLSILLIRYLSDEFVGLMFCQLKYLFDLTDDNVQKILKLQIFKLQKKQKVF